MRKFCIMLIFIFFLTINKAFLYAQIRAIQFGKVIDGRGNVIMNGLIIVDGDRIVKVGAGKDISIPAGAEIIDLKSYTAIPGLIDAHTHITFYWDKSPGSNPWAQYGTLGPAVTVFLARENALKALETGVTPARDLGSNDYMDISMRDLINRGAMVGPRMFVAGNGVHISSMPYSTIAHADAGVADGIVEVQKVARQNIAAGVDWIKIYASTGRDKDVTGFQTYTYEEIKAAADVENMGGKRIALPTYGAGAVND